MADVNVSLSVKARIANPEELKAEFHELIGDTEKLSRILEKALAENPPTIGAGIDTSPLEEMINTFSTNMGTKIDGLSTVVSSLERRVSYVIPRVRPLSGRADLAQPLLTQLPEARELLTNEDIEETIKRNMGEQLPSGYSGIEYMNTILNIVKTLASNLPVMSDKDKSFIERVIKDTMNSVMIILDPKAFDYVGKGRVTPLPKEVYTPLKEIFLSGLTGKRFTEEDFEDRVFQLMKEKYPDVEFSRQETRGGKRVDIATLMKLSQGGVVRGLELKRVVDPIMSNIDFITQVQRLIARREIDIEKMADKLKKGGDIQEAIRAGYYEREYLPLVASEMLPSVQDLTSKTGHWQHEMLKKVEDNLEELSEKVSGGVKDEVLHMKDTVRFEEGQIVAETKEGEKITFTRPITAFFDVEKGFKGIIGAKEEEPEVREFTELFSGLTEISKGVKEEMGVEIREKEEAEVSEAERVVLDVMPRIEEEAGRLHNMLEEITEATRIALSHVEDFGEKVGKYLKGNFE